MNRKTFRDSVAVLVLGTAFSAFAEDAYPVYEAVAAGGTREAPVRLDAAEVRVTDAAGAKARTVKFAGLKPTAGTFVKRGGGWLMSSTAMTNFTGTIRVEAGVLMTESPGMTGPADAKAGELFVADGATFAIAPRKGTCADYGMSVFNKIRLRGRGCGGMGALYNGAQGVNARDTFRGQIILDADAWTGGVGANDFGDRSGIAPYALNGHTLTLGKGGSYVMNGARVEPGHIVIADGARLQVQSGFTLKGDASNTLAVKSGGCFGAYNGGGWNAPWKLVLEEDAVLSPSGSNPEDRGRDDRHNWNGPVELHGNVTVNGGAQAFAFNGPVRGAGTFTIRRGWVKVNSPESAIDLVLVPPGEEGGIAGGPQGLAVGNVKGAGPLPKGDFTLKGTWTFPADELGTKALEADGKLTFGKDAALTVEGLADVKYSPGRFTIAHAAGGGIAAPKFDGGKLWRLEASADGKELALVRADGGTAKGGEPLFRAGWMTDTHVGKTRESCRRLKMALELFRKFGVDAVINNGDIADHYYPTGYEAYRAIMDETFAGAKKPQEIYTWAWHDVYEWNGPRVRESTAGQRTACFADVAKRLGIPHKMTDKITVKGYTFLVFPQWTGDIEYGGKKGADAREQAVADAEAAAGGKPVFVVDHVPPGCTVAESVTWGCGDRRKFFENHPGVIHLSGHTHGSLRDENNIWQGNFTAVNVTCLQVWQGDSVGISEPSKENYGACVIEGFADRIVFRRFDVRDGAEYKKWDPWCVPWPFDPKAAPYSFERRRGTTPVPAFAADARVGVRADAPFTGFTLALPPVAEGADSAYRYRISVAEETAQGWRPFKTVEKYTQFYLRPAERAREVTVKLSSGYFESGRTYRFEAAPVNFFGGAGKSVCAEAAAPAAKMPQPLWKSDDPMAELKFIFGDDGTDGGKPVPKKDGWYGMTGGMARLVIPTKAWDVPKGTTVRFTADVETVQETGPGARAYNVQLMRFKPVLATACGRVKTLDGESGVQRYVIEFRKSDDVPYSFVVREGAPGKVKFHSVKSERID